MMTKAMYFYNALCGEIDGCAQMLSKSSCGGWDTLMQQAVHNSNHQQLAHRLIHGVDWSWITTLSSDQQSILPLYQLFIFSKIVSEDFNTDPKTGRLKLSPTPMIDELWHAHLIRPAHYMSMHRILGLRDILDHTPDSMEDNDDMKIERLQALKAVMTSVLPSLIEAMTAIASDHASKHSALCDDMPMLNAEVGEGAAEITVFDS